MAFTIPTFNLTCNIFDGGVIPPLPPVRLTSPCNLSVGRSVRLGSAIGFFNTAYGAMVLLVPALTDIRDAQSNSGPLGDLVEVPAGSGRVYYVSYVDDVGKGFPNEFRFALLAKAVEANGGEFAGFLWPRPIP